MKETDLKVPTSEQVTYNSYLKIHELLSLQNLLSDPQEHDETLFIVIHQVYELWFKQIMHEFSSVSVNLEKQNTFLVIKSMRRISIIMDLLVEQVKVLETMTPNDFNYFRSKLSPASGFQSHQFRLLEYRLGLKNKNYLKYYDTDPEAQTSLKNTLKEKTIYDYLIEFFNHKGVKVPSELLNRNYEDEYESNEALAKELAKVYDKPVMNQELYEVLELFLDFDQKFLLWRYRHVQMVQRVIGLTMGTGGSMGVQYLKTTLSKKVFPEIWDASL